jgi:hypothetical protein
LIVVLFLFHNKNVCQEITKRKALSNTRLGKCVVLKKLRKLKLTARLLPDGTCYKYRYNYRKQEKQNSVSPVDTVLRQNREAVIVTCKEVLSSSNLGAQAITSFSAEFPFHCLCAGTRQRRKKTVQAFYPLEAIASP